MHNVDIMHSFVKPIHMEILLEKSLIDEELENYLNAILFYFTRIETSSTILELSSLTHG